MSNVIFDCPAILSESLIDLSAATKCFPVKCSRASLERWIRRGSRGVRLETVLIASRRYTSREAISRFIRNQQHTEPGKAAPQRTMSAKELTEKSKRFGLPEPEGNR